MPVSAAAQLAGSDRPAPRAAYDDHIAEAATRFHLPAAWISAVMRAESRGNPRAVSVAGAIGLMQIMPATWGQLSARHALGANPYDPRANTLAGAAYLREMLDRYGDLATALAAYNAGPGRVDDYRVTGRPLPPETLAYIARIIPDAGGEIGTLPSRSSAAEPLAWRSAALFVARQRVRPNGGLGPTSASRSAVPAVGAVAEALPAPLPVARADQRSSGLFVSSSDRSAR